MAATTTAPVLHLDEVFADAPDLAGRHFASVRRKLGVGSFAIYAVTTPEAGTTILADHNQAAPAGPEREVLYFVSAGRATFTVDGGEIDAPAGSFVYVGDPNANRAVVAAEAGTTLVSISGKPGEAFRLSAGELLEPFYRLHSNREYDAAADVARAALAEFPGNALALYNLACVDSLLGRKEEALTHLKQALKSNPSLKENAVADEDFDAIRDDQRFDSLVA
jgi:tetratricopeptide (TPR) repeat protein